MIHKCIIWDFDNTLARRNGMWTKSLCNVLKANGLTENYEASINKSFSTGFPWHRHTEAHRDYFEDKTWWGYINSLILKALDNIGLNNAIKNEKIISQFKDEYLNIDEWSLYSDTISNLEYSVKRMNANIILSNHTPELIEIVKGLGIYHYFDCIISSAVVGYDKPNIKIFERVFEVAKYDKYYMIGDSYNADIVGAKNAGITPILVRNQNINNYPYYSDALDGVWQYIL